MENGMDSTYIDTAPAVHIDTAVDIPPPLIKRSSTYPIDRGKNIIITYSILNNT